MKVLAVSDHVEESLLRKHLLEEQCRGVQLVLACGDLPPYYLEFLVSNLNVPLLYIPGNHDGEYPEFYERGKSLAGGCRNVDEDTVWINGWLIGGLGGGFRYKNGAYLYDEKQMSRKVSAMARRLLWNRIKYKRYVDILITHAPPFGIHDEEDLPHRGFKEFLHFMEKYAPKYLIHGHTPRNKGDQGAMSRYLSTWVINTNPYRVLEIGHEAL